MTSFRSFTSSGIYAGTTQAGVSPSLNNTDITSPEVKLYIEGVQVPFQAISISQAYGRRPTADVQIPPASGLMDIIRGYEPKVHIFYKDLNYGGDRLLFWGYITSTNYSRSRQGAGSASVGFHCEHKNSLLSQVVLDYTGWAQPTNPSKTDPNLGDKIKLKSFNSLTMIIQALGGIEGVASEDNKISASNAKVQDAPVNQLDPSLEKHLKRFQGMPAVSINLWNQIKRDCFSDPTINLGLQTMYIPLLEEGMGFFKRISGHPFLEQQVHGKKEPYCHKVDGKEVLVMTPPTVKLPVASAVQQELAVRTIENKAAFSGELNSFDGLLDAFYSSLHYELLTLASPAEINADPDVFVEDFSEKNVEKLAIETVIKPQLPFYYSPLCNVLLPRMYSGMNMSQEEGSIPTRVTATYDAISPQGNNASLTVNYRGPASIREAVAFNALTAAGGATPNTLDLRSTNTYSFHIPGKYEQGRGIRPEATAFPWWLSVFATNQLSRSSSLNKEGRPEKGSEDYNAMMAMTVDWQARNGVVLQQNDSSMIITPAPKKYGLNPYDPNNTSVQPHEKLMYSTVDYEYTKRIAGARSGVIDAIFNPYIIPGYPMDVIDDSPNHPSFHGLCTSVTHTITPNSIQTSVGMAAATTYAELSNYYIPPSPPFLQTALKLINADIDNAVIGETTSQYGDSAAFSNPKSTLLQNPIAKTAANDFYKQVLGVGAAAPEELIHFSSGQAYPVDRRNGIFVPRIAPQGGTLPDARGSKLVGPGGRSLVDYYSVVGNLRLVSRPIESKDSIGSKFGYNFIDLNPVLYNSTYINYVNPILSANFYLEPGASLFLDYMEIDDFITAAKER